MVGDGTHLSESNDYPTELHRSALMPGLVERTASLAVFSSTLMGSLVARSVDNFRVYLRISVGFLQGPRAW
eukprot:9156866-Lingulodinium_polyedra.AAC.1